MKHRFYRIVAFVLALCMMLSFMPAQVSASETENKTGQITPAINSLDEMYQLVYTDASIQETGLNYRLYVPADYAHDADDALPLLVYLNGAGTRGTDNSSQLKNLAPFLEPLINDPDHRCIIVVPQLPESDKWVNTAWSEGSYDASIEESNSARLMMGLIGQLQQEYVVDSNRIYIMGQSFGGYGTWDLITRHPETFAAAVPMCGAGCLERAAAVKDMPLLVLHGDADTTVPVSGSREMVQAVKNAGNTTITYLEYPGDDHYIQRRIFEQPELYLDWLFSQSKDQTGTAPDVSDCYMPVKTMNMSSGQASQFTVTGGTVATSGQLTLTPDSSKTAIALLNNTQSYADGMLTVHINNGAPNGVGVIVRAQDSKNYVHVRYNSKGYVDVYEFVDGKSVNSESIPHTHADKRISCMRVELSGKTMDVLVNNKHITTYTIQTPALQTSGSVGLRTYSTAAAKYDDMIWYEKEGTEPAIRLSSPQDRQVIQRNVETENAAVPVSGRANGLTGLKIRVVEWESDDVVMDWIDIPVQSGSFATEITVPQGGWYKLELEGTDAEEQTVYAESQRFGVGMNILMIGQSNMVGQGKDTALEADDRASNFMNEIWSHLEDPYDKGDITAISKDGSYGTSMVPALVNALIEEFDIPVGVIPAAKSGAGLVCDCTSYPRWLDRNENDPDDRSNLYGNSLYRAKAAGGIELIVMNQGEHDVSGNTTQEEYMNGLQNLLDYYRTDLGWDVPLFYCQLGSQQASSWNDSKNSAISDIRRAQALASDPDDGLILALTEIDLTTKSDNLHFDTASQNVIGQRMANAIVWYYDESADKVEYYTGPRITGAKFTDDSCEVVNVTIAHGGGTDFTPVENITGFDAVSADRVLTPTKAVRLDEVTIQLTFSEALDELAQIRYLYGMIPDTTSAVKDNSVLNLPMLPGEVELLSTNPVKMVERLIKAIGEVTLDSNDAIETAREAYDALTDIQKQEVTNYQTLLNAETEYMVLVSGKNSEDAQAAAQAAKDAQKAAEAAQNQAQTAAQAAKDAQAKADAAQDAAETAKKEAEDAKTAAAEAAANAGEDAAAAETAQKAAEAAQVKAEAAEAAAETAQKAAEAAQTKAADAQAKAEAANAAAEAAAQAAKENNEAAAEEAEKAAKEAAKSAEEAAKGAAEALKSAASATESAKSAAESAAYAAQAAASAKDAQLAQKAAEEAQAKAEADKKAAEEAKAAAEAAQKAAEEAALNGAKYRAALNLDTYAQKVDQSGYDAEQIEAFAAIVSDAKVAIADAESIDEVQELLDEAKAAVDAVEDLCSSNAYTDVAKDAWYHEYVDFMVENGYMNGVSDTLFDVNGSVTRAQLVTILYRTAGEPSVEGLENPFTDVADGKWYTDAIIWAADEGIVKGVTETEFAPDAKITREQIVTILYRYDGEEEVEEDQLADFSDADKISNYAKAAMNWAIANEIVNGVTETTLAPADTATRAQICAIVMRYLEK